MNSTSRRVGNRKIIMALTINSKSKVTPSDWVNNFLPRISGNLIVKYADKEHKVIGYLSDCERLILQDPQQSYCELIVEIAYVKPLLRKMDSMTSDEKERYQELLDGVINQSTGVWEVTEWLNRNLFDYKDLIGKELAEEM